MGAVQVEDPESAGEGQSLRTFAEARRLNKELVRRAQAVYDEWDEENIDEYAGGGICHLIADAFAEVLQAAGIDVCAVCSNCEQHVYVICQLREGVYTLDLPYSTYEIGAGYSWEKIPDVVFDTSDLVWMQLDANPARYPDYTES